MKLNKKGFAFSTMLYGTAALIAVVLYVILNITKSSSDTTYYYGEEILKDLNDCVTEEVQLENCYTSGGICDKTSYYACLGVSDSDSSSKGIVIAEKLKERLNESDGLVVDPYIEKRYIYRGSIVKNYIEYAGRLWRILSIEPGGSIKIIDINSSLNLKWDNANDSEWNNSSLYSYLNVNYFPNISDKTKILNSKWNKAYIYPSLNETGLNLSDLISQELNREDETTVFGNVGILSISDYFKAGDTDLCENNVLENTSCISWLSNYQSWVIDINAEKTPTDEDTNNYAYFWNTGHKVGEDIVTSEKMVYPVIQLNRNSVIISGDGTESNPYKIR